MLKKGFTLIELLIVVAIIAILAAIAVPNFLEAQTRAKVSRISADMRSLRTGIESYYVDNNAYPETDFGETVLTNVGAGLLRITTPIAYMTTIPTSPFDEKAIGGAPRHSNTNGWVLWVNAKTLSAANGVTDVAPADGLDDSYNRDRSFYLAGNITGSTTLFQVRSSGEWMMKSVGPDNLDDINVLGQDARIYDPTNGTVSAGDIVIFSDTQGPARQR